MNYMRLWMGVLKETSVNFFVLWEFVYYAKYSSGYILGNSLTGDKKIFRAVQEVVTLLEWCSTDGSSGAATRHTGPRHLKTGVDVGKFDSIGLQQRCDCLLASSSDQTSSAERIISFS